MKFFKIVHSLLFLLTLIGSAVTIVASLCPPISPPLAICAVLVTVPLAYASTTSALALGLLLLPMGGNRPGTTQACWAIVFGSAIFLGATSRDFISKGRDAYRLKTEEVRQPLVCLALLYCLLSSASLSSVPLNHVIIDLLNTVSRESFQTLSMSVISLLRTSEHRMLFCFYSVFATLLSYCLGLIAYRACTREPSSGTVLIVSALSGLLLSMIAGILDYYGIISLTWLRSLDPIVNPNNLQFRLQSFFGHSGWYAEFVTLAIPACLIVLSLPAPFWVRAVGIISCLALGEFVLILTYQRGGWISYPLTLFCVWAAVYVVRLIEKGRADVWLAFRTSLIKILISLPITIVISLMMVLVLQKQSSVTDSLSPYVSRFKDIQRTSDRTNFLYAGSLIGSLHPVLGGGADSFAWQFEREIESSTGHFPKRYDLPLHGSAHNLYAQTFSGKGIFGLLSLVAIPIFLIISALRILREHTRTKRDKLIAVMGACFASAFIIYGNVQEVFYVQILQFFFFVVVGVVSSVPHCLPLLQEKTCRRLARASVAVMALHLFWEFAQPGLTRNFYREQGPIGCYGNESTPQGGIYKWCGERARWTASIPTDRTELLITFEGGPIPQTIAIAAEGTPSISLTLAPGERKSISLPVSDSLRNTPEITITARSSSSFVPALLWPNSGDIRRLSFKVVGEAAG